MHVWNSENTYLNHAAEDRRGPNVSLNSQPEAGVNHV